MENIIKQVQQELVEKKSHPAFKAGDTIILSYKIVEGNKERIQKFQGIVLQKRNTTFTIRKISNGVGVERIFPYNSPFIDSIEVLKKGKVRRARLFYLRDAKGKAAKIKEKISAVTA
ncbi:MAG: 50S ribosomal protein L19 [Flavobacteriales bacterium]|nr:50S ribosomal protein L19 [Flavobacteriales bacterium]